MKTIKSIILENLNSDITLYHGTDIKLLNTNTLKENRENTVNKVKNASIGTLLDQSDIYVYVQKLHHTYDDFIDGDLGERIEQYDSYRLEWIDLDRLDLDEWYWDEEIVDQWISNFSSDYPPIVYDPKYDSIIDGTHRANMVDKMGLKKN